VVIVGQLVRAVWEGDGGILPMDQDAPQSSGNVPERERLHLFVSGTLPGRQGSFPDLSGCYPTRALPKSSGSVPEPEGPYLFAPGAAQLVRAAARSSPGAVRLVWGVCPNLWAFPRGCVVAIRRVLPAGQFYLGCRHEIGQCHDPGSRRIYSL
jgi:hypothetical protein